jgi:hypothetical protein
MSIFNWSARQPAEEPERPERPKTLALHSTRAIAQVVNDFYQHGRLYHPRERGRWVDLSEFSTYLHGIADTLPNGERLIHFAENIYAMQDFLNALERSITWNEDDE